MAADLLCLQWNEFEANQRSSYRSLRKTPDFSDVTLVCEDGQRIEAHRLVLSSSSLFFQDLLQKEARQHPLVFMRGLAHVTLASLVDFIYHGEAEVKKVNLEEFLKVAGELRVKGMTKPDPDAGQVIDQDISDSAPEVVEEKSQDDAKTDAKEEVLIDITREKLDCDECGKTYGSKGSLRNHMYAHKKSRETDSDEKVENVGDQISDMDINDVITGETAQNEMIRKRLDCDECGKSYGSKGSLRNHKYSHKKSGLVNPMDTSEEKYDANVGGSLEDNKLDLDLSIGENLLWEERIDALAEHGEDGWSCKQCGKHDRNRFTTRRHIETHIEGFTFSCTLCEKTFAQRNHLKTHMGVNHGGWNSRKENKCNSCNKVERSAPALKLHKQKVHFDEA